MHEGLQLLRWRLQLKQQQGVPFADKTCMVYDLAPELGLPHEHAQTTVCIMCNVDLQMCFEQTKVILDDTILNQTGNCNLESADRFCHGL